MQRTVDLDDLSEKEAKFVREFVDFLKYKKIKKKNKNTVRKSENKIEFAAWPSNGISEITREEIYDYL